MDRRSVQTDQHLRDLLRAGRASSGNMSQRAAAQRTGISTVYWQKIESGTQPDAPAETLATMFRTVGFTASRLREAGYPDIADCLEHMSGPPQATPEDHLAATPGATAEEVSALQAIWRALRAQRTTEPADDSEERRNNSNGHNNQ